MSIYFFEMKQIISILAVSVCMMSFAVQGNREIIIEQFERLSGDWEGLLESTSFEDNLTKNVAPAKCESKYDGKAWVYTVTYDEGNGEYYTGAGECLVNNEGTMMMYNRVKWNITDVTQSADTTRIVMTTKGKDNRKKAELRQTLEVTDRTFSIIEEVRYEAESDYFVRNKHLFRKKG